MALEIAYGDELVATTWKSPASGLWVAQESGSFLGLVERVDGRYAVSDSTGRDLGTFDELADAQVALDGFSGAPLSTVRDVLLMKAIVALTGVIGITLALSFVLRWQ